MFLLRCVDIYDFAQMMCVPPPGEEFAFLSFPPSLSLSLSLYQLPDPSVDLLLFLCTLTLEGSFQDAFTFHHRAWTNPAQHLGFAILWRSLKSHNKIMGQTR